MTSEHKSELDSVQTHRIGDLTEQDARHERELSAVTRQFEEKICGLEVQWRERVREAREERGRQAEDEWRTKVIQQHRSQNSKTFSELYWVVHLVLDYILLTMS